MVKTNAIPVIDQVDDEVAETDVAVADEVVATYLVPIVTADTKVITHASTEPFVHTNGEFLGGPIDRSMFTEYADHVAY